MSDNPEHLRKLANCVEELREVDGVEIEESEVVEAVEGSGMLAFMNGGVPETSEKLLIVLDPVDEDRPPYPDEIDTEE